MSENAPNANNRKRWVIAGALAVGLMIAWVAEPGLGRISGMASGAVDGSDGRLFAHWQESDIAGGCESGLFKAIIGEKCDRCVEFVCADDKLDEMCR